RGPSRPVGHDCGDRSASPSPAAAAPAPAALSRSFWLRLTAGRRLNTGRRWTRAFPIDGSRLLTPRLSSGRCFDTFFGRRFLDDDAFEWAGATLVEFQPARQQLDAHLEILDFDAEPRRFQD